MSVSPSGYTHLAEWLHYLEGVHPSPIELGLDRVQLVYNRLNIEFTCPIITVGGTNGKGSTSAILTSILATDGYQTGLYQSPHLLRYNERIQINQVAVSDAEIINAFNAVEIARHEQSVVSLTYFEFGTLAAFWLFAQHKNPAPLDAIVLEVGLGGRLDAVNILDPDCAILTSIDLDHQSYLGNDREAIGWEKAHIFRSNRPAICADPTPPNSLKNFAQEYRVPLFCLGSEFGYQISNLNNGRQWTYWRGTRPHKHQQPIDTERLSDNPSIAAHYKYRHGLPLPALAGRHQLSNASAALAALDSLGDRLLISGEAIKRGLINVSIPGRFQVIAGRPVIILDVAHNPHAAKALANTLSDMQFFPKTFAVLGLLSDKDVTGIIDLLRPHIDHWYLADLPGPRGLTAAYIKTTLLAAGVSQANLDCYPSPELATQAAIKTAQDTDRIVVFGSFLTVAGAIGVVSSSS